VNWLDLLIIVFFFAALGNGYRRGFSLSFFSYGGLIAGTAMGAFLAPFAERLFGGNPGMSPFVALGVLFIAASVGSSLGYALGEPVRLRVQRLRDARAFDATAGAAFSAITVLATSWFLGLAFVRVAPVAGLIEGSAVLRTLDAVFPRPPGFLIAVEQILSDVPYPEVFDVLNPNLPGPVSVDPAVANDPGVVAAGRVTVKVQSLGCGGEVFGSAFPVGTDYLVSNAHVVAGTTDHRVLTPDGRVIRAVVVLFDPERDISILHVPGLRLGGLTDASAARGDAGATIGYPGGGNESIDAAAVRARVYATGRDIYGQARVTREIYVLTANIRPGNSGGPLVDAQGRALGVVFANSTADPSEGYALTDDEVRPDIQTGVGRTAAVSTQGCAS